MVLGFLLISEFMIVGCFFNEHFDFSFIFLKRFLTWWYHRKIRRNEIAMEKLKKQKAKILDEVMETETYKVAKELLDEFATDAEKRQLNVSKNISRF